MGKINYDTVTIPEGLKKKDYDYVQRRAAILKLSRLAGHPRTISQSKLAETYGVGQPMICQDFKAIKKFIERDISSDDIFHTELFYDKVRKLAAKANNIDDAWKAVKIVESHNNFHFELGKLKRAPKDINVNDVTGRKTMKELYEEAQKKKSAGTDRKKKSK